MAKTKPLKALDINAEEKIKKAARIVFHKKGFAATRTRDIADEAGINLALLNYYFRSKQNLFEIVMGETITHFYRNMDLVFNDKSTTLERKVQLVTEKYIDMLIAEPDILLFLMSEIKSHPTQLLQKLPTAKTILQSHFVNQYKERIKKGEIAGGNPLQFLMSLMGLIAYPFISSPVLKRIGKLSNTQFEKLMNERKKLIPVWISALLKAK